VSFVLLWQPSECIDLFVISDYIFVSFSENKYDDDDVAFNRLWLAFLLVTVKLWASERNKNLPTPIILSPYGVT